MKRCCRQCGKDTRGQYCSACSPWVHGPEYAEQKIRKKDKIVTHDDDLIRDEDSGTTAYTPPPKVDPYHGSTTRDDI